MPSIITGRRVAIRNLEGANIVKPSVDCLIGYSGIGVIVFILLLTNPEVWKESGRRSLSRWFIIVPLPFLIGLVSLLSTYVHPISRMHDLGWAGITFGTILLFAIYIIFLFLTIAPPSIYRLISRTGKIMRRMGLSLHKSANQFDSLHRTQD